MILPQIEKTASEVLHLLSFLGPDGITKPLLRHLLSAKKNLDEKMEAENIYQTTKKNQIQTFGPVIVCGLILGGSALVLPSLKRHRTGICAVLAIAATSVLVFSRIMAGANDDHLPDSEPTVRRVSSMSASFSAFEYEQSDRSWDILKSFSLLSVKVGKGSVHRLLQQAMRSCQSDEESVYYMTICIEAMAACWTFKPSQIETWKESLPMLEHVKSLVIHCQECCFDAKYTLKVAQLSKEAGVLSLMALNAFLVHYGLRDRKSVVNHSEP